MTALKRAEDDKKGQGNSQLLLSVLVPLRKSLIVELGIIGPIFWLLLGFAVAASTWKVVKTLKGTPWFPLAFAIAAYAVLLFFPVEFVSSDAYQDYVLNSDLWLLLGILYRLRLFPEAFQSAAQAAVHT